MQSNTKAYEKWHWLFYRLTLVRTAVLICLCISPVRADEIKEHAFFRNLDWQQVYMQQYPPPLIPPRGEVNAADAFDIGSFDEEDTKGIKVRVIMV